jgi:2-polyprenyl-3-methyl-5-hydroxy-6-metoxy-1,4-benzoquinol methylase
LDYSFFSILSEDTIDKVGTTNFQDSNLTKYSLSKITDPSWISPKIRMYSYLLWLALRGMDKEKCIFVDYGGGLGLMSVLAKAAGVKTVVYIDIDSYTCKDAQLIGTKLEHAADYYLCGDIQTLNTFSSSKNFNNVVLVSYDVLEHIYDINSYLRNLKSLSKKSLRIVMCSGANPFNPYMAHEIISRQNRLEYKGRIGEAAVRNNDYSGSYFEARLNMIRTHAPKLSDEAASLLAVKTRGLRKQEILLTVDRYLNNKKAPRLVNHPTNTCDPFSGNWEEQLMNPHHLTRVLNYEGFETKVLSGFYFSKRKSAVNKRIIKTFLNAIIESLRCSSIALPISPFYIVSGELVNANLGMEN